jgi:glutamine synthetase
VLARPDPTPSSSSPGTSRRRRRWPGSSATSSTSTGPRSRAAPAHRLRRTLDGPRPPASPSSPRRRSSTSTSPTRPGGDPRTRSTRALLRPDGTADLGQRPPPRTVLTLEEMGIPVEHAQHEDAPSQHEIDLRYTDALTMADTVMTVRHVVKELARQAGIARASCPSPWPACRGPGMHTHLSLWRGRRQRVRRRHDPLRAVRSPWVHRRPAAPRGRDHRGHQPVGQLLQAAGPGLRGPGPRQLGAQQPLRARAGPRGQGGQARVDPGRVPRAGQRVQPVPGLRRHPGGRARRHRGGLRAAPEADGTCSTLSREELANKGSSLPGSLKEAVDEMEGSKLLAETLGEHVFEWFLRNKRAEWAAYKPRSPSSSSTATLPLL